LKVVLVFVIYIILKIYYYFIVTVYYCMVVIVMKYILVGSWLLLHIYHVKRQELTCKPVY